MSCRSWAREEASISPLRDTTTPTLSDRCPPPPVELPNRSVAGFEALAKPPRPPRALKHTTAGDPRESSNAESHVAFLIGWSLGRAQKASFYDGTGSSGVL